MPALFATLAAFLFGSVPIFVALGLSTLLVLMFIVAPAPEIMIQRLFGGIDRFALMSMPFFILAANIMREGGLADRILEWTRAIVGSLRGGVALTTELACMFFGALSGSSPATVVAIGTIMYPELIAKKYGKAFATGLITASGSVALVIPPSITLIVYGATTGTSVGALFIGGIGAGVVYGLFFLAYCLYYARKHQLPGGEPTSPARIWRTTVEAIWALGVPIIILGGIYAGVFTPTEAAGISVVYALFVSMVIYREMTLSQLYEVCVTSAITIAQILVLVSCAAAFGWLLTVGQVPQQLAAAVLGISESPLFFLLVVNIIFLVAGMFVDGTAAIIILAPLVFPLSAQMGINPVHLGVLMVTNLAIGMFTPPFGLNLFVGSAVTKLSVVRVIPGVLPFIVVSLVALAVITYLPEVTLFLPRLVYGGV